MRESEECRWGEHGDCRSCRCSCHPRGSRSRPPVETKWAVTDIRGAHWTPDPLDDDPAA